MLLRRASRNSHHTGLTYRYSLYTTDADFYVTNKYSSKTVQKACYQSVVRKTSTRIYPTLTVASKFARVEFY